MAKLMTRPTFILAIYVAAIGSFAGAYDLLPAASFGKDLNLRESIYLSVVTITTLGYGDITPKDGAGMFLTALEAIVGILVVGAFINSAWKRHADRLDAEQSQRLQKALGRSNRINLSAYFNYLSGIFDEYQHITYELTTPLAKRGGGEPIFRKNFKFCDLKDLLGPSLLMKYGVDSNSVIAIYFNVERSLAYELKYVLANFSLEDFPDIKELIVAFLLACQRTSMEDALLSYAKHDKNSTLRKMLEEMISKNEGLPPKEYHQSNILTPVIVLFQAISIKMDVVAKLTDAFRSLTAPI